MTFIDFFAGIGGIRLGLEMAGMECVGYVENDKFARQTYEIMHDTEGEWTAWDVKDLQPSQVPDADLWAFGFPCQDVSVAGRREGLDGKRSSLFYEVTRLLKGKKAEDRPEWLLVENVKNLLSIDGGRGFERVLLEMAQIGYGVEYRLLNSSEFGVPQNRERVFMVCKKEKRQDGFERQ